MAEICERVARSVIERVVDEAVSAARLVGFDRAHGDAYAAGIETTLPIAFDAMRMPDGPERATRIGELATAVRGVSDANRIPRIVERGLVAIAVRIAREVVRRGAAERGFTPDELEREFVTFADLLEDRLFRE